MEDFIQEIHFDCDTVWKNEYVSKLLSITNNEELLDFVIEQQQDDVYDGFTEKGRWFADKSLGFLKWKLSKETNWLNPPVQTEKVQIVSCSKCKLIEDEFTNGENPEDFDWIKKNKRWYCGPCGRSLTK